MRCVTYTRVSSKEQEREGYSIPAQEKLLLEYAHKHGFEIVKSFSDVETAKASGRTEFGRMLEYFKLHTDVRRLLVEKTDRLYRNFADYVALAALDLELHLVKESEVISKDSQSHVKLTHDIKVVLAKNFIDNLREEVRKGMLEKAEQGEYPARAPLGYLNDKIRKRIFVDPEYAPLIKRMFELYATGKHSLVSIRDLVYEEGWRTRSERKISKSVVDVTLKNPFYIGDFVWRGIRYTGCHDQLIDRSLFDQVQALMRSLNHPRTDRREFLFKGLLTCKFCGCAIVGEVKKGKYTYYHCTHARGSCDQPWVREEVVDECMASIFEAIQIDESTVTDIVRALKDSHKDEVDFREKEVKRLSRKHAELQTRLDRSYEDRLDGVIDDRLWRDVTSKWRTEQDQLSARLEQLKQTDRNYIEQAVEILELSKMAHSLYLSRMAAEKRQLLRTVLSNCSFDGLTLYPTYNKPFNYIAEGRQNQIKLPQLDEIRNSLLDPSIQLLTDRLTELYTAAEIA